MSAQRMDEPAVEAVDRTIHSGSIRPAHDLLMETVDRGLARRLDRILRLSSPDAPPFLRSSRDAAYRDFVRYVEAVRDIARDVRAYDPEDGSLERTPRR